MIHRILASRFPRRFAAASLKHQVLRGGHGPAAAFSAAIRRGLIEAVPAIERELLHVEGFPRRFAAASLKLLNRRRTPREALRFSAAIRRGLIEAIALVPGCFASGSVFRGDSPRPH